MKIRKCPNNKNINKDLIFKIHKLSKPIYPLANLALACPRPSPPPPLASSMRSRFSSPLQRRGNARNAVKRRQSENLGFRYFSLPRKSPLTFWTWRAPSECKCDFVVRVGTRHEEGEGEEGKKLGDFQVWGNEKWAWQLELPRKKIIKLGTF